MDAPRQDDRGRWSYPLVTVAGVTIRVHVTFALLVALVALSASSLGEPMAPAIGWLAVLFGCVVLHELAHTAVARAKGIAVHEIDLLPIGGVSRMERIPEDWRDEAAIAVAGPAASVAVAAGAFGLAALNGRALLPVDVVEGAVLTRAGWANLLLAGFNLLPAFPLDGGRVLRALLERDLDRVAATRRAAGVSRVLAFVMIGLGALLNLWLLVIGVFVLAAGRAEEAAVLVHAALGPTPASALAVPCPVSLPARMPAGDAVAVAGLHPQVAYPVVADDGTLLGLVNLGTLRGAAPAAPLADLAAGPVVDALASLEDVVTTMEGGSVAVVGSDGPIGVITPDSLDAYFRLRLHEVAS